MHEINTAQRCFLDRALHIQLTNDTSHLFCLNIIAPFFVQSKQITSSRPLVNLSVLSWEFQVVVKVLDTVWIFFLFPLVSIRHKFILWRQQSTA